MSLATRRAFIGAAAASAATAGMGAAASPSPERGLPALGAAGSERGLPALDSNQAAAGEQEHPHPTLFVLVHGTGHGGWCWKFVREILEAQGHRVYTPTLTGCGERSHLLHPDLGLDTHILDIANVLEWEELENVVMVGHSYGGLVISGVADRMKDRLRHLVYLDAIVPRDGDSLLTARRDISPEEMAANEAQLRRIAPDGNYIQGASGRMFGIPAEPPEILAWVDRRLTPHPIKSWLDPVKFENGGEEGVPCTFIQCTEPAMPGAGLDAHAQHAKDHPNWRYVELKTGHDAMVTEPQACADLFLEAALSS